MQVVALPEKAPDDVHTEQAADVWYRWEGHSEYFLLTKLRIIKRTERGVVLDYYGKHKFVLNNSHKQFACPTEDAATIYFIKRKERQIRILATALQRATDDLATFLLPDHKQLPSSTVPIWLR